MLSQATLKWFTTLAMASLLAACGGGGGESENPSTPLSGEQLFSQADSAGNQFSCSTCHATSENGQGLDEQGLHRPAHSLLNATHRNAFYNGSFSEVIDAVNNCRVDWMDASPYASDSAQWLSLEEYLVSLSDNGDAPEITFNQVAAISYFSAADPNEGHDLFNQTCATCHGQNAAGSNLARTLVASGLSAQQVASKVRSSGPTSSSYFSNLSGGNMPFWSEQRLSDAELADIATYLESINTAQSYTCNASDHPKVGQVAMLSTLSHGVSGRVEILDNCTIEVSEFNYDGGGPDVLFYGAPSSNYNQGGFAIGDTINGPIYNNDTLQLSLDNAEQLDQLAGISVWCRDFSVSFGDGLFN
ncbi:DM13 domain-containing protein [Agarivorans sp. Alg241-V36]|uniref:DM13 domain-containing protein n=1 Tax=Agarivorans sp. Alg241-V36 TaxID=2305992 RepID=UPI0013D765C3|nr:DM13 domain-containing protein [Agarivorans sp. Alg241-V36]